VLDIEYFMKAHDFKLAALRGEVSDQARAAELLESFRSREPVVYNIETTNACNMRCEMCPRTTKMTRPVETLDLATFRRVIDQLKPHAADRWAAWESFVTGRYGIRPDEMSENHFFLYIIPKVIQLHGYGDPLLDKNMGECVKLLKERGFFSYFSCNPANIDLDKTLEMFGNGLDYIKYSIESVDDERHKAIRGKASDFTESYQKILQLLDRKQRDGFGTTIIITMLDLNKDRQQDEFAKLRQAFAGKDVYIYLKSEDQQWYRKDFHGTKSVHWTEFCQHPWMTMTIKSNGEATMCMEDYNNEIVLGDVRRESLAEIWNGERYRRFRQDHFDLTPGLKCTGECDMKLIGSLVKV